MSDNSKDGESNTLVFGSHMPAEWIDQLLTALNAGDSDAATKTLAEAGELANTEERTRLAQGLSRRKRWSQAAWVYSQIDPSQRSLAARLDLNLAKNLAELAEHRPEIYRQLSDLTPDGRYRIGEQAGSLPTVLARREADGQFISLSPNNDPQQAVAQCLAQLEPVLNRGESVGLCGVGDGYFLKSLAESSRPLFLTMQQPVTLIEPDLHALRAALALHDYSGATGPIQQARFRWFVGADWAQQFAATLKSDPFIGCPTATVSQALHAKEIQEKLGDFVDRIGQHDEHARREVEAYYANESRESLDELLAPGSPRKPRVLLLTTRFSTVLQYATADAARGFEQAGWEAKIIIEPTDAHRLYQPAIRRELLDFKPDALFQIDHLRHEHGELFPPSLPFICWMQDHLPNLHNHYAATTVGPTDFLLTDAPSTYVTTFGYPARQFIPVAKLTRVVPPVYVGPASPRDEIIFVSNASHTPQKAMDQLSSALHCSESEKEFALECGRRVVARYFKGDSLPTYVDVCDLIRQTAADGGVGLDDASFRTLARLLTHPFNDCLYRQQALRWAASAANELGLSLGLYGKGWEDNQEFARHARGPIENGPALHELTARTPINLQIVPYLCLHQRLLDGVMSGGFFMVRRHPADWAPQHLLDLLESPDLVNDLANVHAGVVRDSKRALCSLGTEDLATMIGDWEAAALIVRGEGVLPDLDQVSFDNACELRVRLARFMNDESARRRIVERQSASISRRFSYAGAMSRIGQTMAARLAPAGASNIREAA